MPGKLTVMIRLQEVPASGENIVLDASHLLALASTFSVACMRVVSSFSPQKTSVFPNIENVFFNLKRLDVEFNKTY